MFDILGNCVSKLMIETHVKVSSLIKVFLTITPMTRMNIHYEEKKGVLQLALQLDFWVAPNICNSLYLYVVNVNK